MNNNILITSIASKVPLIKRVKSAAIKFNKNSKVFGADLNPKVVGSFFVDEFWQMCEIKQIKLDNIIGYCQKNKIGYIIPTRDEDIIFFSKNKQKLLDEKIYTFTPDYKAALLCFDKLYFYENIDWCIKTSSDIENIKSNEYVVKERYGSGAKEVAVGVNKEEALKTSLDLNEAIFQPFINGVEYSVDAYVDKSNNLIGAVIRSRDLVIDGESKITTSVKDNTLKQKVKIFLESNNIQGHSVLQVIKKDNSYHLIECNTRFGGASTLSYELGLESFLWFLQESNKQVPKVDISNKIITQVRYNKDMFFGN